MNYDVAYSSAAHNFYVEVYKFFLVQLIMILKKLQSSQVNSHIRVKWVTFSLGHAGRQVKLKESRLTQVYNAL